LGDFLRKIYGRTYMLTRTIRTAENRLTLPVFKEALYNARQCRKPGVTAFFTAEAYGTDRRPGGGGLGTLSWDNMQGCADMGINMVLVSIAHRMLHKQTFIVDQFKRPYWQDDVFVDARLCDNPNLVKLDQKLHMRLQGREVPTTMFGTLIEGRRGVIPGLLLSSADCGIPGFSEITDKLYPGKHTPFYTFGQEILLGLGGVRALKELGIPVELYHLNDGHPALAAMQVLAEMGVRVEDLNEENMAALREKISYTSHTLVGAANEMHSLYDLHDLIRDDNIEKLAERFGSQYGAISMIKMALNAAGRICAVSQLNAELFRQNNPEHNSRIVGGITNAVNADWTARPVAEVYDSAAPAWETNPENLSGLAVLKDDAGFRAKFWGAHMEAKLALISYVDQSRSEIERAGLDPNIFGRKLDPDWLTVGFARRVAGYKRHNLIISDVANLVASIASDRPVQLVFAGKAHPMDNEPGGGKYILQHLLMEGEKLNREFGDKIKFVFLPNYDVEMARTLIPGVDIWMNTPIWGHEASGTSTMNAILNGVLLLTTYDGCVPEMDSLGNIGWIFGRREFEDKDRNYVSDSYGLYSALSAASEAYYNALKTGRFASGAPTLWVDKMIDTVSNVVPYFLSPRLIKQYSSMMWGQG
jgi:starch phosphorylase